MKGLLKYEFNEKLLPQIIKLTEMKLKKYITENFRVFNLFFFIMSTGFINDKVSILRKDRNPPINIDSTSLIPNPTTEAEVRDY